MAKNFRRIQDGINIVPKSTSTISEAGDIDYSTDTGKFNFYGSGGASPVVTETGSASLSNKNLIDSSVFFVDVSDNSKKIGFDAGGTTSTSTIITAAQTANRVITLPNATDTLVGKATTDTLSNKTLDNSTILTIKDTNLTIQDDGDTTKQLKFQLSGITTATTRTLIIPDANTTIVGTDATQTLTNKTLTAPIISTIVNTGTLTLPTSTDTLIGRNTTDTLTNKTLKDTTTIIGAAADVTKAVKFDISGSTTGTTTTLSFSQTGNRTILIPNADTTLMGDTTTNQVSNKTFLDGSNFFANTSDVSKKIQFDLSGITTATTRTLIIPDANTTLVGIGVTQTLTNKTFGDAITGIQISTPSNPSAGRNKLYFKSDNILYSLTSAGVESPAVAVTYTADNSTLQLSSNIFSMKDQGTTQAKLALRAYAQVASAGGFAISPSCGTYSNSTGTFTQPSNLGVTLTTLGRPVKIGLMHNAATGTSSYVGLQFTANGPQVTGRVQILRDSTVISITKLEITLDAGSNIHSYLIPVSTINCIDMVAAGTYTYSVQAVLDTGGADGIVIREAVMYAYEQ